MSRIDLTRLRKSAGMSQRELASRLQVRPSFLSAIENGRSRLPEEKQEKIKEIFGLDTLDEYLVEETSDLVVPPHTHGHGHDFVPPHTHTPPHIHDNLPPHTHEVVPPHSHDIIPPHSHEVLPPHTHDHLAPHSHEAGPPNSHELPMSHSHDEDSAMVRIDFLEKRNITLEQRNDRLSERVDTLRDELDALRSENLRLKELLLQHGLTY